MLYSDKTIKFNVSCSSDILTYTLIDNSEWLAVTDFNKELLILNSKTGEIISQRYLFIVILLEKSKRKSLN